MSQIEQALSRLSERLSSGEVALYLGPELPRSWTGVPSWSDLAQEMGKTWRSDKVDSWPRMASRYLDQFGRQDLVDWLERQIGLSEPGPIYHILASLPLQRYIGLTYDDLLERALESRGRRPNRIVRAADLNYIRSNRPSVVRLLGGISSGWREELLFTAADLMSLPEKRSEIIRRQVLPAFTTQTLLIIGQDLNADYFRNLYFLGAPQDSPDRRRAYAVWSGLQQWEKDSWAKAQVTVIEGDPLDFLGQLQARLPPGQLRPDGRDATPAELVPIIVVSERQEVKDLAGPSNGEALVENEKGVDPLDLEKEDAYENFDLDLSVIRDIFRVEVSGSMGEVRFDHEAVAVRDPELHEILAYLRGLVAKDEDVKLLGQMLRNFLFPPTIWTKYKETLGASGEADGLRIRLRFHKDEAELIRLPWEYCRDDRDFFALNTRTPVVRYLKTDLAPKPISVPDPVRVLIATASPKGYDSLSVMEEADLVKRALEALNKKGDTKGDSEDVRRRKGSSGDLENRVVVKVMHQADMLRLDEEIAIPGGFRPHILHFIGHGTLENGQGKLVLEDGGGEAAPVGGEALLRTLRERHSRVRVVILNACQTAAYLSDQAISGLAPRLVWGGVPAVIAMQFPVPDRMATVFATDLFRSLAGGAPLDEAVSTARRRASFAGISYWGIPVLYMRSPDGVIWTK